MIKQDKLKEIESTILSIPDYPKPGILFRDISPIFLNPKVLSDVIDIFCEKTKHLDFDVIVGPEARGFLFGVPLAYKLKKPFVMVRKKGKLPRKTFEVSYELEYGEAIIEMHEDALRSGLKVLVVDDLLATGGTIKAINKLIHQTGAIITGNLFLIELTSISPKSGLDGEVISILKYE